MANKRVVTIEQGTSGRNEGFFTVRADGRIADMLDKGEMLHCVASIFYANFMPYSQPTSDERRCGACGENWVQSRFLNACPHCGIAALLSPPDELSAA